MIVLCYSDILSTQRADARTLVTLLHLRDMVDRSGVPFTITSEMLDDRNRELAEVTKVDDVIVSDKLISLLVTQISENHHLTAVFDELFSRKGRSCTCARRGTTCGSVSRRRSARSWSRRCGAGRWRSATGSWADATAARSGA